MTKYMGRTLKDAMIAAVRRENDLPHIVQVEPSDYDTIIMSAEITRLRRALYDILDLQFGAEGYAKVIARSALGGTQ